MIRLQQTVLLVSITLVGACAGPSTKTAHGCPGSNPGVVPITINYNLDPIKVTPESQTANEGDALKFNLVGSDNIQVSTSGKTPEAGWLNSNGKRKPGKAASYHFYVCVPRDLFPKETKKGDVKTYGYNVNAVGKPQLDPKVRIIKN